MKLTQKAFTLVEILVVVGIMAFVIIGMGQLFIYASMTAELAGNKSIAVSLAQNKIEEIRNHTYGNIPADYANGGTPGNAFSIPGLDGIGLVRIDSSDSELLGVEVLIFWQNRYGHIMGEDRDLDGVLDGDEDANSNSKLDSPVTLVTKLTRR